MDWTYCICGHPILLGKRQCIPCQVKDVVERDPDAKHARHIGAMFTTRANSVKRDAMMASLLAIQTGTADAPDDASIQVLLQMNMMHSKAERRALQASTLLGRLQAE